MSEKSFNVLITGAGTTTAVTVLKGLKALNDPSIRVVMGDMQQDCAGAYLGDEFVLMPAASHADFDEIVVGICRKHNIELVVPIIDYEFAGWSRISERLMSSGTRVLISNPDVITQCEQKDLTIQYFRKIGVPCPDTWLASEVNDPSALPFPVFLKPRCGRASLNSDRADNLDEYLHYTSRTTDLIVQPCLDGDEVTIDTFSGFDGRLLAASPRIRVEVKSGQAYRSITIDAPELSGYARKIAENLPILGPSNIQCFLTEDGPQFFEINARFGAGTVLSINAGLNGPAAAVAMVRGVPLPQLNPRPGVLMLRYWQEVFVERNGVPIFLDLDGPILDVTRRHHQVYRDILQEAGITALPFEEYWQKKCAQEPHSTIVSQTAGEDFFSNVFQQQWLHRIETGDYLSLDRVWPWVHEVLSALYRRHEIYLLTVRSYPDQLMKQLDSLNLTRWFRAVLCRPARQNAAREKVHAIRKHFRDIPTEAVIVGDTEADIECGKELGFLTVGVLSGIRDRERLQALHCDHLLDSIDTLPRLLANLGEPNGASG